MANEVSTTSNPFKIEIEEHVTAFKHAASQLTNPDIHLDEQHRLALLTAYREDRAWLAHFAINVEDAPLVPGEPEDLAGEIEEHLEKITIASINCDAAEVDLRKAAERRYREHYAWLTTHQISFRYSREEGRYVQVDD